MLCKIKETMKEWLIENERLYWYIIIGLAVFAFGFITMLGMSKLERANAAESVTSEFLNGYVAYEKAKVVLEEQKGIDADSLGYHLVLKTISKSYGDSYDRYDILFNEVAMPIEDYTGIAGYPYAVGASPFWLVRIDSNGNISVSDSVFPVFRSLDFVMYANYDVMYNGSVCCASGNLDALFDYKELVYYVNAPYLKFESYSCDSFAVDGKISPSSQYMKYKTEMQNENIPNMSFMKYEVQYYIDVYMPTQEWLDDCIDRKYGLLGEQAFYQWLYEEYSQWYKGVSSNKVEYRTYTLMISQELDAPCGDVELSLSRTELIALLLNQYGGVDSLYNWDGMPLEIGASAKSELVNCLFAYMTVGQIDSIVTSHRARQLLYGRYVTSIFRYDMPVIEYEYTDDFYKPGADSPDYDDELKNAIVNAYIEHSNNLLNEKNELQDVLDFYYQGDNAFSEYNTSDVWSYLSDTAKGLVSVTGTLTGIAAVLSVIFSFLPFQITQLLMGVFVVCIFTAIIRFIRG